VPRNIGRNYRRPGTNSRGDRYGRRRNESDKGAPGWRTRSACSFCGRSTGLQTGLDRADFAQRAFRPADGRCGPLRQRKSNCPPSSPSHAAHWRATSTSWRRITYRCGKPADPACKQPRCAMARPRHSAMRRAIFTHRRNPARTRSANLPGTEASTTAARANHAHFGHVMCKKSISVESFAKSGALPRIACAIRLAVRSFRA
jgi:hypothetical protein